ncbi:MAG: ATP-binding protein [Armatimonadetes bacterium]|nr:ATP-binding protein [Armatimonadota bacterium]
MDITTHPLETLDEETRRQIVDALAGDGPDLALLLAELAGVALAQEKTKLANNLYNSALYQEDARGRSGGALAVECLEALCTTAFSLGDYGAAARWAMRLAAVAPDDKTRRRATQLRRRAEKKALASANPHAPQPSRTVGGTLLTAFEAAEPGVTFADVGGMAAAKQALERVAILPHRHPESAKRFGITTGGGVLLYGPPGCGKTLLARAAAGEMGVPILEVKSSDILHPLYGMAERNFSEAFRAAREKAPCVLFIDEIDGLAQRRDSDFMNRSLVNLLLVETDSSAPNEGVLIIAATNELKRVDPALLRPGRFDKLVEVLPPDAPAREAIWLIRLRDVPCAEGIDMPLLVELSAGLSGADIAEVARSATEAVWMQSLHEGADRVVELHDLLLAMRYGGFVDGAAKNRIDELIAEDLLRGIEG